MIEFQNSPASEQLYLLSAVLCAIASMFSILGKLKPNSKWLWPLLPANAPFEARVRCGRAIAAVAIVVLLTSAAYNFSQSGPYIHYLLSAK